MTELTLRPYQSEGVAAVAAGIRRGLRRTAVVWPTGAGKTVGFAKIGRDWREAYPHQRVLALAHTTELVDQMMAKFRSVAPGLRIGRVQGQANETLAPIVCASVATLRNENRRKMIRDVGLIIVDECHHAVAKTYLDILTHYGALGPERPDSARAIGFTATMTRADRLALGDVWQDVVHVVTISDMVNQGYLVRPRGIHVRVDDLDLSQVKTSRGDYREGDLGRAIEESLAPEAIAKAVAEHASDRRIILFAPTVHSAQVIAEALAGTGRRIDTIHGALSPSARAELLGRFRARELDSVAGCMVLTEGFDEPSADCVVIARPTKSAGLYVQMVGRVLRPYPGKHDALVLDVVGASTRHSLRVGLDMFGDAAIREPKEEPIDPMALDLEDLEAAEEAGREEYEPLGGANGPLVAQEIDLFAGSAKAWMRTQAGVFFLAAGERYIAILPGLNPGTFDVTSMHKDRVNTGRWVAQGIEDLSYAMAWAEQDITPTEQMTAAKDRGWRIGRPSEKMTAFAHRLGIHVPPGARGGEVSTMITQRLASQRIDSALPPWTLRG